jgi:hypothetical protein
MSGNLQPCGIASHLMSGSRRDTGSSPLRAGARPAGFVAKLLVPLYAPPEDPAAPAAS